jgi:predicted PurR-regulated permease PerM
MAESPLNPADSPPSSWSARHMVQATLVVVGLVVGFWLLYVNRVALFSLFVAIVLSTAIAPAVDWLYQRKVPRALGVVAIYLGLLAVVVGAAWVLVPLVAEQGTHLVTEVSRQYLSLVNTLQASPSRLVRRLALQLPVTLSFGPASSTGLEATEAATQVLDYLGLVGDGLFLLIAVLLLAFYWTLDRERLVRSFLLLLPTDQRDGARELYTAFETKVGGYIRGEAVLCLIVGSLALAAYLLIGLPNAIVLGLAAGLFEAVPVVGPALGALPAVAVALTSDPQKAIWVLVATAVIQFTENTFLVPRVMGRAVGVNPIVTLLAVVGFGKLFGLPGALLAIPLAAAFQLLLDRFVLTPTPTEATAPIGRDRVSVVRYEAQELVQDVRKLVRDKPETSAAEVDQVEDAIETLASDIDTLLARAAPQKKPPFRLLRTRRPAGPARLP